MGFNAPSGIKLKTLFNKEHINHFLILIRSVSVEELLSKLSGSTKDFVLKSCLVLCDFDDISFKVDNFNRTNMLKIQDEWENITKAIRSAVALVASFGFNRENITSNNLFIPIAYYLKQIGLPDNFDSSSSTIIKITKH